MFPTQHDLSAAMDEFVASRSKSRLDVRYGEPTGLLVIVGGIAGGFARLAAHVERWARGTGDAAKAAKVAAPKGTAAGW